MNREHARRFCIDCSYPLVEAGRRRCPECGRRYDSDQAATTTTYPLEAAQRSARMYTRVATLLLAFALLYVIVQCALGGDPMMFGAVTGVLGSPVVLILLILPASARATSRLPWMRQLFVSACLVVAIVMTILSNWPLRLEFLFLRDELDRVADRIQRGGQIVPQRVGLLEIEGGWLEEPGVVQIWNRRPAGSFGGIGLLRCPAEYEVWGNVYWEINLGGNWRAIAED